MEIEKTWIRHPNIDDGERVIQVPKEGLPHYHRSGWQECDAPPDRSPFAHEARPPAGTSSSEPPGDQLSEQTEAPESPGLSHVQGKPAARRRASKERDE
ncbi:hypothetical protein [Spongiactinospora sp. TRM90649]|uniref:hypothetical protein n=1 Tax=Spongiactinospora sp. TRM90649 TaxID=3031114 RepID=UPI0023F7F80C|nr:hypothetical protein [Spongiactinospora sp. TRM90649]MDF5755822.1 hypothetical protein [Spongiactinospora sp. TRM90649]